MILFSSSDRRAGRRSAAGALALAAIWLGVSVAPQSAAGHAGEVHTEPAPAVEPGTSGPKPEARGQAGSQRDQTTNDQREAKGSQEAEGRTAGPVEPETDPTLHFVALGALLLGGGGFLLFRRRRLLA